MVESEYSIKDLEQLVQAGTMKKKIVKSTYTREFFSRLSRVFTAGLAITGIGVGLASAFYHLSRSSYPDLSFSDVLVGSSIFSGMVGGYVCAFGSLPVFYKWRERAKPYVEAGGKVIYKDKRTRRQFTLPLNFQNDGETKLKFERPFSGYVDNPDY